MASSTTDSSFSNAKRYPLEVDNSQDEQEELLLRDETYDNSETSDYDDDHDNDNDDDDEEDDSLSSTSSWRDIVVWSAWRQHAAAILVAILATILATVWQQSMATEDKYANPDLSPVYASTFRHEHLDGYHRTTNISFCGSLTSKIEDKLELMDFHLPLASLPAFQLHFVADAMEDDDYSRVLGRANHLPSISNDDYHCLQQLEATANSNGKSFVKGMTYFYQPPSYLDMFPEVNQQYAIAVASNTKRNTKPKPAALTFTGFAAKFINLSPHPVLLFWDGKGGHANSAKLVGEIAPFDSLGTATTPGQSFSVTPVYDSSHALDRWVATADEAVLVYEDTKKRDKWTESDLQLYHMQLANLEFAKHYLIASHRPWLAHFPRAFPVHPMRSADIVGQTHAVTVADETNDGTRQLTMEVVSVTPRVLSIDNFLSRQECLALMQLAQAQGLQGSTLYAGGMAQQQRDTSTRSSTNTWLGRDTNALTDVVYKRAAKVLQMKESLLQQPSFYLDDADETAPHHDYTQHSIAESLQVVRYQPGEEYTAHHDFVYPSLRHRYQPTRYATLLLYLNDNFEGGQTNFPRAVNPSNHEGITITPSQGKAVLFYNVLPDGNVDDLSQHRSMPVTKGEKWLANLWIWDPVIN